MQNLAGLLARVSRGVKTLSIYAGLGASLVGIYAFFVDDRIGTERNQSQEDAAPTAGQNAVAVEGDRPGLAASLGLSPRAPVPAQTPTAQTPTAQTPTSPPVVPTPAELAAAPQTLTDRISTEVGLRLAEGPCRTAGLRVLDAQTSTMTADQTTHGFAATRMTANLGVTFDGRTVLLPVQGSGKGPASAGEAFATLLQAAMSRIAETFPKCVP